MLIKSRPLLDHHGNTIDFDEMSDGSDDEAADELDQDKEAEDPNFTSPI